MAPWPSRNETGSDKAGTDATGRTTAQSIDGSADNPAAGRCPGKYANLKFSPHHFRSKDLDIRLLSIIAAHGVTPDQVRIEVGVETPIRRDALRELDCTLGQGYWFAHPQPLEQLLALR